MARIARMLGHQISGLTLDSRISKHTDNYSINNMGIKCVEGQKVFCLHKCCNDLCSEKTNLLVLAQDLFSEEFFCCN